MKSTYHLGEKQRMLDAKHLNLKCAMQALSVEVEVSKNPNFLMKVLRRGDDEAR